MLLKTTDLKFKNGTASPPTTAPLMVPCRPTYYVGLLNRSIKLVRLFNNAFIVIGVLYSNKKVLKFKKHIFRAGAEWSELSESLSTQKYID